MANQVVFVGFSTNEMEGKRGWSLTDIELVKRDLLNHFFTRRGERLMMPTYGTIIWDLLFEPFTDSVQQQVIDDVITVVNSDPRVLLTDVHASVSEHGITVVVDLKYTPWSAIGSFELNFDRRSLERKAT